MRRPSLAILVLAALSTVAQPRPAPPTKPPPKPWLEMDYGPVLSTTLESAYPARNITQKGILIRLDQKSQTYVLFDEDLCRYSIAYTGGFINFKGVLFDGEHRVWPSVVGQPIFGLGLAPGWAKAGDFADPRTRYNSTEYTKESDDWKNRPYGPLPHDHAQYKGLYVHGQQVVLSYTVAGTPILDSPGLERSGDEALATRTINIAKSERDLDLNVLQGAPGGASVLSIGGLSAAPKTPFVASGTAILIPTESAAPESTPPDPAKHPRAPAIQVQIVNDNPALTWRITDDGHVRLHIPASATPAKFKLAIARQTGPELAKSPSPKVEDLADLTRGGPPRYPQQLTTTGVIAPTTDKPYVIDTIAAPNDNPFKSRMRFGAFDFFPNGKSAAISTWDGDVWLVTGIDDKLDHLIWLRIATGLYQPLGLKILPHAGAERREPRDQSAAPDLAASDIYVLCRDQLARLHDLDNDGEIDFIECVNNDAQVTEHFHEFAMGLQTDADGNFYYAKSARHALDAVVPQHGTLLRISRDGARTDILANGFRAANGVGIGPNGELAATDQEGFYTPANRINLILNTPGQSAASPSAASAAPDSPRDRRTPFFGNLWSYLATPRTTKDGYDPPLCWIPPAVDRSPAEDLWVTSDKWGPLKGSLLHTSYGTGKLFLVPYETIDGVPQGGVVGFPDIAFRTGVMRACFNPTDGQLYCCGLVGWATNMTEPGGFHRVRYTGAPVHMPRELHVQKDAIKITFTNPLDPATANDPASYAAQQWAYRWTQNYGSKQYSVADPNKVGQDDIDITAATLSPDGKTVTLTIPGLKPVMQMKLQLNLKSADGLPIKHTIHQTINRVP